MNNIDNNSPYCTVNYKALILSKIILTIFKEESSYSYKSYYQIIKAFLIKGLNLCDSIDDIVCVFSDIPNINNTLNHFPRKTPLDISTDILNFKINNIEIIELIKELYIKKLLIGQ